MAFNTRPIKTDLNDKPIPQYYDPAIDDYQPLEGQHGAARSILYGPDGNPISAANRLPVDAAVSGTVDVSDRADRQLGQVALTGRIVKRTYLGNKFTFIPSEEWVLLEDYELGENTIRWGLFFKEHARPLNEVLEKLAVNVSIYHQPGEFGRINSIFERTMYPSLEDSPLHPLAIPGYDDQQANINNIILYNKPFTYNLGGYLRISLINKSASNMTIARAMLVEEGYQ